MRLSNGFVIDKEKTFGVKRTCVLFKTSLRFRENVKAFELKRFGVLEAGVSC